MILELQSYQAQSPNDNRAWVDTDELQAVVETSAGPTKCTALILKDREAFLLVKDDARQIVTVWKAAKGQTQDATN
jgi:hypothetical protein